MSSEKSQPSVKWLYVILSILLMMIYGTVYSWSIFRVAVEETFEVGSTLSGLPYMISLMTYAISMLIGGRLISKYKPRTLLVAGGILITIGWLLSFLSPNIFILTVAFGVLIGFGVGISYGVPIYVMAKWFPKNKGLIVGSVLAGFGLSPLVTAPLGHWLIEGFGLKQTFLIYGLIFGILIPILSSVIKLPPSDKAIMDSSHGKFSIVNEMTKSKTFPFAYGSFFIGTTVGLTIIGLTNHVGKDLIGMEASQVAFLITLFAIFNGLGRPLFAWMTEKFQPTFAMRVSYTFIMLASGVMLLAGEGSVVLFVLAFAILWLNLGAWLAIAPMMTMSLYGMKSYSENYGIMFTAYGFGAVMGVSSTGLLIDMVGNYAYMFILIFLLAAVGFVMSGKVKVQDEKSNLSHAKRKRPQRGNV